MRAKSINIISFFLSDWSLFLQTVQYVRKPVKTISNILKTPTEH